MSSSKTKESHAYVQYLVDREKEIISTSQILNGNVIARGKVVQLHWNNEHTEKTEVYEAYIHFLCTSELDVERQVDEAQKSGHRLSLPSQKILEGEKLQGLPEEVKTKKTKMDSAKEMTNKTILTQKWRNNEFLKSRETLSLDEDDDIADVSHNLNDSQDSNANDVDSSNCKESEQNSTNLEDSEKNASRRNESEKNSSNHAESELDSSQCTESEPNLTESISSELNDENVNPLSSKSKEADSQSSVSLKKYDRVNDQIYLGGGIFMETQEWQCIEGISGHGAFIIALATSIWGDQLKDMCIDKKKAKARAAGQIRKKFPTKKLEAMEDLFRDKLRSQGFKGRKRIKEMVKTVRRTLTHKVNDLNKQKTPRRRGESDSEEEEEDERLRV